MEPVSCYVTQYSGEWDLSVVMLHSTAANGTCHLLCYTVQRRMGPVSWCVTQYSGEWDLSVVMLHSTAAANRSVIEDWKGQGGKLL